VDLIHRGIFIRDTDRLPDGRRAIADTGCLMKNHRIPTNGPSLADQLRQAIIDSGKSHYGIAKATGLAQPVITRFANGTRTITLETANILAVYFQLKLKPAR
jgi:hypothetical protein